MAASIYEPQTLQASAAQTATSTGTTPVYALPAMEKPVNGVVFMLDLTAAATESGDLLDVYIQTIYDATNWVDIVHFTQCAGNGGAKRYYVKVNADVAQAMFENGAALGAGAIRNLIGKQFRVRWTIVDAGTANASFTFSVTATPV